MVSFAKVGAWTSARTGADERSGGVERERARVASSAATVPHVVVLTPQSPERRRHIHDKTGELSRTSDGAHKLTLPLARAHTRPLSLATRLGNRWRYFFSLRRRASIAPEHDHHGAGARSARRRHSPSNKAPTPELAAGGTRIRSPEHVVEAPHSQESHIRARLDYAHRAGKQFRWRVQLPLAATGIIGLLIAIVVGVFSVVYNGPILLSIALIMVGPSFLFLALSLTPVETYLVKLGISLCIVVEIFFAAIMQSGVTILARLILPRAQPLAAQMAPRRGWACRGQPSGRPPS
mmetsp:Transcript_37165/g.92468  ORF Transcript_37165/g.92468 Transcript_37165/m.92468 type:complete len:293 (-) Transcript_37165:221-1099(-)